MVSYGDQFSSSLTAIHIAVSVPQLSLPPVPTHCYTASGVGLKAQEEVKAIWVPLTDSVDPNRALCVIIPDGADLKFRSHTNLGKQCSCQRVSDEVGTGCI